MLPASAVVSTIGSLLGGVGQSRQASSDRKAEDARRRRELQQQQNQFDQNLAENTRQYNGGFAQKQFDQNVDANTSYGDRAQGLNRELELLPMRDKAAAMVMQRMGAAPKMPAPRSINDGGTDALRAPSGPLPYDLEANRASAAAYKSGDGGMSGDVQRQLLDRFMNVPKSPEMNGVAPVATAPVRTPLDDEIDKARQALDQADADGVPFAIRQSLGKRLELLQAKKAAGGN